MAKKLDISDILANVGNKKCDRCGKESEYADFGDLPFQCEECEAIDKSAHDEASESIKNEVSFSYDIDLLLTGADFLGALRNRLPNPWDTEDSQLFNVERTLRGIAEFSAMSGNGFLNLIQNENYDVCRRSISAAEDLGDILLSQAMSELAVILTQFGFPECPDACVVHSSELNKSDRDSFEESIRQLDKRYFFGNDSENLWNTPTYLDVAREFARSNHAILLQRKNATSSGRSTA